MPEITLVHIALIVVATLVGAIAAWIVRGNRAELEKSAVSAGWQEQIDAQRREKQRLVDQNKGLMEQISQFQASHRDAKNRAQELSQAVQEAFARRDELQREIKDIRSNLETALHERRLLQSDIDARAAERDTLLEKDQRIEHLARELRNWQDRLPPLIEKFRQRNEDAERLEQSLAAARERIAELENARVEYPGHETRIEPVSDPDELTDGLDASNDPAEDNSLDDDLAVDDAEEADADAAEDGAEVDAAERADSVDFGGLDRSDDLQQIKGVGPAIEKTLNELGIFRFEQIADMSEYDIDRVAKHLKGFRSRIYREDWIGQARDLRDQETHA